MKKIVTFTMGNKDTASMCHSILASSGAVGCSMVVGSAIAIQVDEDDVGRVLQAARLEAESISDVVVPDDDVVCCSSVFSSSGKAGDRGGFLTKAEALRRFCKLSGLIPASGESYVEFGAVTIKALPVEKHAKFNIVNRFQVSGNFEVVDRAKFNNAVMNGIGTRRSYGYGLILSEGMGNL